MTSTKELGRYAKFVDAGKATRIPMGETQREVLRSLAKPSRGFWYSGCGWLWDTPSGTRKIMETLLKRGLVTKTMVPYTHTPDCTYPRYDLTDEGRRVAEEPRDPA